MAFQRHLHEHYSREQARELFRIESFAEAAFPKKGETLLEAELNRFWCSTTQEQLATLKSVGSKELGKDFLVFPNGGDPTFIQRAMAEADFVMFEKSHGDYGTHPGLVVNQVFPGVTLRAYNNNVFEYKFVQCLRRRVKPIVLSRAGYPWRPPERFLNANAARLGMAECGAFSGGGAFLLRPHWGVYHDALNENRRFFETRSRLFAGLETYASVAVLVCPEQQWLGNAPHLDAARSLTDTLTGAHILFDFVPETRLTESTLAGYPSVVAADLLVVSRNHLNALTAYVNHGGHLIVVGDFAIQDEFLSDRALEESALLRVMEEAAERTSLFGRGRVTRLAQIEHVPAVVNRGALLLQCPDESLAAQVKVNAFQTLAGAPSRIVVHLVNYNVPLGVDAPPPVPVEGIVLNLSLPERTRVALVKSYAPDQADAMRLSVEQVGSQARIVVPTVRVYRVLEVLLE